MPCVWCTVYVRYGYKQVFINVGECVLRGDNLYTTSGSKTESWVWQRGGRWHSEDNQQTPLTCIVAGCTWIQWSLTHHSPFTQLVSTHVRRIKHSLEWYMRKMTWGQLIIKGQGSDSSPIRAHFSRNNHEQYLMVHERKPLTFRQQITSRSRYRPRKSVQ